MSVVLRFSAGTGGRPRLLSPKRATAYYQKHGGNSTILEIPEEADASRQKAPTIP